MQIYVIMPDQSQVCKDDVLKNALEKLVTAELESCLEKLNAMVVLKFFSSLKRSLVLHRPATVARRVRYCTIVLVKVAGWREACPTQISSSESLQVSLISQCVAAKKLFCLSCADNYWLYLGNVRTNLKNSFVALKLISFLSVKHSFSVYCGLLAEDFFSVRAMSWRVEILDSAISISSARMPSMAIVSLFCSRPT